MSYDWHSEAARRAEAKRQYIELEKRKSEIEANCPVLLSLRMRRAAEHVLGVEPAEDTCSTPSRIAESLDVAALEDDLASVVALFTTQHKIPPAYVSHFLARAARRCMGDEPLPAGADAVYESLLEGFKEVMRELSVQGIQWTPCQPMPLLQPIKLRRARGTQLRKPPEAAAAALPSQRRFHADTELLLSGARRENGGSLRGWFGGGAEAWRKPETESRREACRIAAAGAASLPLVGQKEDIKRLVRENQLILVQAETGSGKTTQVPQYILEMAQEDARSGAKDPDQPIRIVCTQPKRIAAVSVARRVSIERGELFGGGTLGYKIRGESQCGPATRILYCTVGVLLRRLASEGRDSMFSPETVTHLLVDEIHERSSEVDFLLTFLRQALPVKPQLRVVLMSATIDAESFLRYFTREGPGGEPLVPPMVSLPGRLFPVEVVYREHVENMLFPNKKEEEERRRKRREEAAVKAQAQKATNDPMRDGWDPRRRGGTGKMKRREDDDDDEDEAKDGIPFDLIAKLVSRIAISPTGAWEFVEGRAQTSEGVQEGQKPSVLVFLPGVNDIVECMEALQKENAAGRWWILPLHGGLVISEQERCFSTNWRNTYDLKVICATNVAETSVTIPDVTVVIDSCLERRNQVDRYSNTPALREQFCAIDSLTQRRGRAGRVQPGVCFRLIQESFVKELQTITTPEMRRVPLENLYLQVCASGIEDRLGFLRMTPDPPEETAILFAEAALRDIGALDLSNADGLTPLGRHLAMLPCNPRLGKILVLSCLLDCPGPCVSIVSALSMRSPFVGSPDQASRDTWGRRRSRLASLDGCQRSDHCVWALLVRRWMISGQSEQEWLCRYYGLAAERMHQAVAERRILCEALANVGLAPKDFYEREREQTEEERKAHREERARRAIERLEAKELEHAEAARQRAKASLSPTSGAEAGGKAGGKGFGKGGGKGSKTGSDGRDRGKGRGPNVGSDQHSWSEKGKGENGAKAELEIEYEDDLEMEETGWPTASIDWAMVRAAVIGGLYPNVVKVERVVPHSMPRNGQPDRSLQLWARQRHHSMNEALAYPKGVDVHPGSLCAREECFGCPWLVFFTLQLTKKLFAYDVTEAAPFPLLLFGSPPDFDPETKHIEIGSWVRFWCPSAPTVLPAVAAARDAVGRVLAQKLVDPTMDHTASRELALCIAMLRTNGLGFGECPSGPALS